MPESRPIPERPPLRLTKAEWDDLPEYSATMPTGRTPGKRWKRHDGAHDTAFLRGGGKPKWIVGEFYEVADPTKIGIRWYRPVVKGKPVRALLGASEAAHA